MAAGAGTVHEDCWATLGVSPDSTTSEIRAAYRSLALIFHPDRTSGLPESAQNIAAARMRTVNEAYERAIATRTPRPPAEQSAARADVADGREPLTPEQIDCAVWNVKVWLAGARFHAKTRVPDQRLRSSCPAWDADLAAVRANPRAFAENVSDWHREGHAPSMRAATGDPAALVTVGKARANRATACDHCGPTIDRDIERYATRVAEAERLAG